MFGHWQVTNGHLHWVPAPAETGKQAEQEVRRGMARMDTWLAVLGMNERELTRQGLSPEALSQAWEVLFRQCPQDLAALQASEAGL